MTANKHLFLLSGRVLYWGERIDSASNRLAVLELAIRKIINFLLLLFSISGFIILAYAGYSQGFDILLTSFFWNRPSFTLFFFWLSIFSDLYLLYRLMREEELRSPVLRRPYGEAVVSAASPISFEEAQKIKKGLWADISKSFTKAAMRSVRLAYDIASGAKDKEVAPIHLFAGLLSTTEAAIVFGRLGINGATLRDKVLRAISERKAGINETAFNSETMECLEKAYYLAFLNKSSFVGPELMLAAIVSIPGLVKEILYDLEIDERKINNVIAWQEINNKLSERFKLGRALARRRPTHEAGRAMASIATPYLDSFAEDMTLFARYGRLSPIVGREKEIESVLRILESSSAPVVLVGNPGVGKDAILSGIAQRMVEEDVPKMLSDKRLVSVSIAKIVSGASAPEAIERMYNIFNEVARAGNVVLYFPNIHEFCAIGKGASGSLDLASALSAELSKRYFLAIGSTNPEGQRAIERSPLGNVLQKVDILEPKADAAIQILESKVGIFENKNKIFFSYDAIEKAAMLSDKYLPDRFLPEKAIEVLQEAANQVRKKKGENGVVSGEDVAEIISEKSHVPVTKVTEQESDKLLNLESRMAERVVGQKEAIKAVASAIRRARAGLRAGGRPIANFLFLGPTGVGKTETAKTVAEVYFGNEENMIRLDMSEYQDQASLYRMIGEPGKAGGGLLTEAVRKQPFTLLLLDEIEKAHPDILNIFLQVMDDGRLTDNEGRTVDFSNIILIATSNAGTQVIQDEMKKGTSVEAVKNLLINQELRNYFRPEFLNRFDGIIVFTPLSESEIQQVARLMLNAVAKQLEEKGVTLRVTDEALIELATAGFDPTFGARPLRRVIQERVQDALANFLLQKKISRRDVVVLGPDGAITIEKAEAL